MIDYIKSHKWVFGTVGFLVILTVASIITYSLSHQPQPPADSESVLIPTPDSVYNADDDAIYGPTLVINNWSDNVRNLPNDEKLQVESTLYSTLANNLPDQPLPADAVPEIRAGTYHQTYDAATQIYYTEFLVDIPAVRQTYRVVDQYSDLPRSESGLFDYTTMVFCPTEAELIWEAFECTDRMKIELGE